MSRATAPHTDDNYRDACKKKGVEPRSEVLSDGTVAHWIGKKSADKIILNFHGELFSVNIVEVRGLYKLLDRRQVV